VSVLKGAFDVLPIVSEQSRKALEETLLADLEGWKSGMVQHIREENPEVNSLLLKLAQKVRDPKSFILGGYLVYKLLELAEDEESQGINSILE
jgi:hypothetical protein